MKTEIIKLKNFEGYYFTCCCCGKELKHPYAIKSDNNFGTYGKECVHKIVGYNWKAINITSNKTDPRAVYEKLQNLRLYDVIKMLFTPTQIKEFLR